MKTRAGNLWAGLLASTYFAIGTSAAVLHVDLNNTNAVLPYADWATAATDIQSAIDASSDGDLILVTNGVYQTGGRVVYGSLTNRVVIDKAVTVQSVNGPAVTVIQGYQVPGSLNGAGAVRCVYLTNNAALLGFTLTNGATTDGGSIPTGSGGGVWCENSSVTVSNCVITHNACLLFGAGICSGTAYNCQIIGNTNQYTSAGIGGGGGGAALSTLFDCTISNNYQATFSGGAFSCALSNCIISANSMSGVMNCVLDDCTLENNTNNNYGGGARLSTLNHCLINNNQAALYGGGAYQCELNFCIVSNNWAGNRGGGVYEIPNVTNRCGVGSQIIGNSSVFGGGVYFTGAGQNVLSNWSFSGWSFISNSAAQDGGGIYQPPNINNCVFNGNHAGGNGGGFCNPSPSTLITVSNCTFTGNSAVGYGGGVYGGSLINCLVAGNEGGNGGGVYGLINNCVINDNIAATNGGGVLLLAPLGPPIICSNSFFTNNLAGNGGGSYGASGSVIFSNCVFFGNTAITNGGGIYQATLKNCSVISNQAASGGGGFGVIFQNCTISNNQAALGGGGCGGSFSGCSIAGNMATDSGGGICFNSINSSPIFATNCIFTDNHAATNGGGAYCPSSIFIVSRCRFLGNSAGANGGGTYGMNLVNCLLVGNSAANGGGSYSVSPTTSPNNSTIVGNTATINGGGVYFPSSGSIASCIIYDNNAPVGANYFGALSGTAICTTPLPPGSGNITNDPAFVSFAGGNFRLQTNSPCINVGGNIPGPIDLDGRPRIVGGRIDIGAYEFQGPGMGEFIGWLQQYGLPTDGSADYVDSDGDGMNNWQEWIAGTDPTNAASVLQLESPSANGSGVTLTWQSVSGVTYYLQRSTNLLAQPAFSAIQSNLVGQAGLTSYTDTTATNGGPFFYRIGVQ